MVIDQFLPVYDISKRYSTVIAAPVDKVYSALKNSDINNSPYIRFLFFLRGLPAVFKPQNRNSKKKRLTLDDIAGSGFILLDEKPNDEIVIGVVGRFWKITGNIQRIQTESFLTFNEKGFAKAAWNFSLKSVDGGRTELTTETRVRCTDEKSRRKFRYYWSVIGPFSGLIRKEMLKIVKREAEINYAQS
jgi:hypothetical protein